MQRRKLGKSYFSTCFI